MTMPPRRSLPACAAAFALCLAASPPAAAVTPPQATVANQVVTVPSPSGIGTMSFRTSYEETTATGTAFSNPLRLELGYEYRLRTCVWTKAPGVAPQSVCEEASTRPNALTLVTGVTAPTARMTVDRPAAGRPAATIAGIVLVDRRSTSNTYTPYATSWPSGGLPAAGHPVPASDQLTAPVLGPQGVAIPGFPGGGIN